MVMTVSNVRRMSKSFEANGGGTATTVASLTGLADVSSEVVPVAERVGGAVPEGSTLERLDLGLN